MASSNFKALNYCIVLYWQELTRTMLILCYVFGKNVCITDKTFFYHIFVHDWYTDLYVWRIVSSEETIQLAYRRLLVLSICSPDILLGWTIESFSTNNSWIVTIWPKAVGSDNPPTNKQTVHIEQTTYTSLQCTFKFANAFCNMLASVLICTVNLLPPLCIMFYISTDSVLIKLSKVNMRTLFCFMMMFIYVESQTNSQNLRKLYATRERVRDVSSRLWIIRGDSQKCVEYMDIRVEELSALQGDWEQCSVGIGGLGADIDAIESKVNDLLP